MVFLFFRAEGRHHQEIRHVSVIIRVHWLHVDFQRVLEGLLTANRSLEALRHHEFVHCVDRFRRQLENGAVGVLNARRFYRLNTVVIYIYYFDLTL